VDGLTEGRKEPRRSAAACFRAVFLMFAHGEPSLNAFEQRWRQANRLARWKKVFHDPPPRRKAKAFSRAAATPRKNRSPGPE
jgi:hypothetical protein